MNKPKRSPTLDAFVIKKSKNILTVSSDFDQQEKSIENVVSNSSVVNIHQHIINNNVNEITTPPVSPENNQSSIQENHCSLTNSITSNSYFC